MRRSARRRTIQKQAGSAWRQTQPILAELWVDGQLRTQQLDRLVDRWLQERGILANRTTVKILIYVVVLGLAVLFLRLTLVILAILIGIDLLSILTRPRSKRQPPPVRRLSRYEDPRYDYEED